MSLRMCNLMWYTFLWKWSFKDQTPFESHLGRRLTQSCQTNLHAFDSIQTRERLKETLIWYDNMLAVILVPECLISITCPKCLSPWWNWEGICISGRNPLAGKGLRLYFTTWYDQIKIIHQDTKHKNVNFPLTYGSKTQEGTFKITINIK